MSKAHILNSKKDVYMKKTVVILANSIKHQKHCVAGKCIKTNKWIRPVADAAGTELSDIQATYNNKYGQYMVKPKQKIEMGFTAHVPLLNQPDNYLIDNTQWTQKYKIDDLDLYNYLDTPKSLWGHSNKVSYSDIANKKIIIDQSLYLISVKNLSLYFNSDDKRRAKFSYNDTIYDLPVTDPTFEKIISEGKSTTGIICISLGEEYNGYCYKIVATIF